MTTTKPIRRSLSLRDGFPVEVDTDSVVVGVFGNCEAGTGVGRLAFGFGYLQPIERRELDCLIYPLMLRVTYGGSVASRSG